MNDFIRVLNNIEVNPNTLTIEDVYNFRKLNREIYNKAELMGDLNGDLLKVRDIRRLNLIGVDLAMFSITLQDTDDKKLNMALVDITNILKGFLKRFSYLSSLTYDESDKYEYYLNMYPLYDIIKCGNQVVITL